MNTTLYILLFILGFLAGSLFVFIYSLKTINQIHKDYREGRYDLEKQSNGTDKTND
ncbi:MAG: hypothetical protein QF416_10765 [Candidatus Marinimicrobia bacterium]|nr:hypothetical protein [Candidatus Neomarinimicrobiota bacterium]MDP7060937.1 hypothetical protein [Candidatus Neomarinimicrobiota bacterium]